MKQEEHKIATTFTQERKTVAWVGLCVAVLFLMLLFLFLKEQHLYGGGFKEMSSSVGNTVKSGTFNTEER